MPPVVVLQPNLTLISNGSCRSVAFCSPITMQETNEKKRPASNAFAALMKGSKDSGGGAKSAKQQKIEAAVEIGNKDIEAVLQKLSALPATSFTCSIISKGRPKNVQANLALFKGTGVVPTFIIGKGETEAYTKNGAAKCIEGGGLCASRNAAIALVSGTPFKPGCTMCRPTT